MVEFNDGKERAAFRTIGEVSEALGIKPHVLRYWEQQFTLLKPMKRSGGRRLYRPSDIEMVEAINTLVNEEGYTLKGAEAVLRSSGGSGMDRRREDRRVGDRRALESSTDNGSESAAASAPVPAAADAAALAESIAKLKDIRARLARAVEA